MCGVISALSSMTVCSDGGSYCQVPGWPSSKVSCAFIIEYQRLTNTCVRVKHSFAQREPKLQDDFRCRRMISDYLDDLRFLGSKIDENIACLSSWRNFCLESILNRFTTKFVFSVWYRYATGGVHCGRQGDMQ